MEAIDSERFIHQKRSWIATIITVIVLVLLLLFAYRVFYFANQIKSGKIDLATYNFSESFTTNLALAQTPVKTEIVDVVSEDDPSLGSRDAKVVIVEFADFQCPYSQEVSVMMRSLASRYPKDVLYVYRDFPLSDIHPLASMAAEASECAHIQGKFWEYHDKVYQNQSDLTQESFGVFARELNLNTEAFESCLSSGRYISEVQEDYEAGTQAGVRGTPTFFINGNRVAGAIPAEIMEAIVESLLLSN